MRMMETAKKITVFMHRGYHIPELVVFGGDTCSDILARIDQWLSDLDSAKEECGFLKQLAYDTQDEFNKARTPAAFRIALVAFGEGELHKKLAHMRKLIADRPETAFSFPSAGMFYGLGDGAGKVAYLFAGQGSQYPGMGRVLADTFPAARHAWDTLGNMRFGGSSIKEIAFDADHATKEETAAAFLRLSGSEWTNPAIGVAGEAIFNLLEGMGVQPDAVASHSFGDVTALRVAGVISKEDMVHIARRRGELGAYCPQAARGRIVIAQEGAERIRSVLAQNNIENIWMANYNTHGQTALVGVRASVEAAHAIFRKQRIPSRLIPISGAAHCCLCYDAVETFGDFLQTISFKHAGCDVYSFLFGHKVDNDPELFRKLLREHAKKPVRFAHQIERMYQDGVRIFVEVGPGDVLTSMVGQLLEGKPHAAMNTDHRKENLTLFTLMNAVAELFKENRLRCLTPLWEGYRIPRLPSEAPQACTPPLSLADGYLKKLELEFAKIERIHLAARAV